MKRIAVRHHHLPLPVHAQHIGDRFLVGYPRKARGTSRT